MFMYNGYYLEITPNKYNPNILHGECKEVGFHCINNSFDYIISEFRTYINNLEKEETTMTITEQDQDLLLTNQFSEAIDKLIEEILPLIDAKNLYYIINLKLKRIFELYKDTVLYGCSYDELRENTISKIRVIKREEDKKKENPTLTEFNKALENIKRDSDSMSDLLDKLNTLYCLYGSILNLSLDDVKKKYFELNSK